MTDNEMPPQCRAELYVSTYNDHYRCVRPENHAGRHQDDDNDTWDITYVDEPPAPTGLGSVEISDLSRRVTALEAERGSDDLARLHARLTALEAAWTVGGETLSERLDRVILGMQEQHRSVASRVDNLEQTSASGAATDDMFAAVNRRLDMAVDRVARLDALEG